MYAISTRNGSRTALNRVLEDFFDLGFTPPPTCAAQDSRLVEKENGYELQMILPGFTRDEVSIEYEKSVLTVKAIKSEKDRNMVLYANEITRSWRVPDLDMNRAAAKLKDGILTVELPK